MLFFIDSGDPADLLGETETDCDTERSSNKCSSNFSAAVPGLIIYEVYVWCKLCIKIYLTLFLKVK